MIYNSRKWNGVATSAHAINKMVEEVIRELEKGRDIWYQMTGDTLVFGVASEGHIDVYTTRIVTHYTQLDSDDLIVLHPK